MQFYIVYRLLPSDDSNYALLPGAFLITSQGGTPVPASVANPDGSSIVTGVRSNTLDPTASGASLPSAFEVDSSAVVQSRAEFDLFSANTTLAAGATAAGATVPRLPIDAGTLTITATTALQIQGTAQMSAPSGGLGGIDDTGTGQASNTLFLNATDLSNFGAESLLVGGFATAATGGDNITVREPSIEIANDANAPLSGPDVTLVSNGSLTIDSGAAIEQVGTLSNPAATLLLGNASVAGSGDGTLVRVSSDPSAAIVRNSSSLGILIAISSQAAAQQTRQPEPLPQITIEGEPPLARGEDDCAEMPAGSTRSLNCLNQKFQQQVDQINPPSISAPESAKSGDLEIANPAICRPFSSSMDRIFGHSVISFRPQIIFSSSLSRP